MSAPSLPRRRADITVIDIGDEAVLYDPLPPAVHRLNATALLVWQCCDGTADASAISADITETFGEPPGSTRLAVGNLIDGFADNGLLVDSDVPKRRAADAVLPSSLDVPATGSPVRRLGPYGAVDARFTIECHGSEHLAGDLEAMFGSLALEDVAQNPAASTTITVWSDHDGWHMDAVGVRSMVSDQSLLVDAVVQQVTRLAIAASSRYLVLHAATVARDGMAVMLPARANSGKSTLAAIMVEAGFDYLTDEASFVDLDTGEVVAFAKPISLDPGSQQLLAHLAPSSIPGASTKWHIEPTSIRSGAAIERAKLTHIVTPSHDVEADNALLAIDTIDGVVALLAAAVNVADHASRLRDVVALVDSCTVHSLRHHGIAGPRAAIDSLFVAGEGNRAHEH